MANAPEAVLCEIMKAINPAPYKKLMGPDKARLHALLVAADTMRSALDRTGRKNPERDLAALYETHELHLELIARPKVRRSPKRKKVALHADEIQRLLTRVLSLRQICVYLKRHVGLSVNHSYLRQCCHEMGIDTSRGRNRWRPG